MFIYGKVLGTVLGAVELIVVITMMFNPWEFNPWVIIPWETLRDEHVQLMGVHPVNACVIYYMHRSRAFLRGPRTTCLS